MPLLNTFGAGSGRIYSGGFGNKIYDFDTFTFTTAGNVGPLGPTLEEVLNSADNATWAIEQLNMYKPGIISWIVPSTGTFEFEIAGASSVRQYCCSVVGSYYGRGSKFTTRLDLTSGDVLQILVGQLPTNSGNFVSSYNGESYTSTNCFNGGGGATFVVKSDNTPLIVAGGGGSQRTNYNVNQANMDAKLDFTTDGNVGGGGSPGTNGGGGVASGNSTQGTAGGGFTGNATGARDFYYIDAEGFIQGGEGAKCGAEYGKSTLGGNNPQPHGGFGGGGGGGWGGSGGGGGYSGGGGGTNSSAVGYGGGGSNFNTGVLILSPVLSSGPGYVKITTIN